jgi:methyltransferase family protein
MRKLRRGAGIFSAEPAMPKTLFPLGHFYSPIVDVEELRAREARVWPAEPRVLGIDFNDAHHERVLREYFPLFYPDFAYPGKASDDPLEFFLDNDQFSWLDCRALFVLLRAWRPGRFIEVGSGFSTLLVADVNRRFLDRSMQISCIEPYPRDYLRSPALGLERLVTQKVQDVDSALFDELDPGDVLFIDSSHVAKTGSDVNHLCFEVLPRLRRGVRIHFHDIFLPADYPRPWVLDDNRSWNEQYVVRALLMFSDAFGVLFGSSYALVAHAAALREALREPGGGYGGGSLWIEKIA